jgi:hypothetical protein
MEKQATSGEAFLYRCCQFMLLDETLSRVDMYVEMFLNLQSTIVHGLVMLMKKQLLEQVPVFYVGLEFSLSECHSV